MAMLSKVLSAAALLLLGLLVKFFLTLHKRRSWLKGYPMPPHSYLWGHLKIMGETQALLPPNMHPHTYQRYIREKYNLPNVYYIDTWPFGDQILICSDPEANQQITVAHSLPKSDTIAAIAPVSGKDSLVEIDGPKWKMWRSTFNPGFSSVHLTTLVPEIVDCCVVFAKIMEQHADDQSIVQLEEAATKVTVDIIGKVVLDADMNAQTKENEFVTAFRSQLDWLPPFADPNPFKQFHPFRSFVYRRNEKIMNAYLTRIMSQRFESRFQGSISTKPTTKRARPVIDIALDTFMKENGETQTTQLSTSFMQEVLSHIRVFMFGGHDTSSSTICFTAYALSRNPSCLLKFRAECDEIFSTDHADAAQMIKDDPHILNRLPYTTALIKETLRLWPPASSARKGEPGVYVNHGGHAFPTEGTLTWSISHTLHHHPDFWPHVESFIPERWLVKEGDPLFPVKGAWRPFEFGPRSCIGQELAMMEMKIVMVLLWRGFMVEMAFDEWEEGQRGGIWKGGRGKGGVKVTPEGERAYQILIATAKPCDGMPVRVVRR